MGSWCAENLWNVQAWAERNLGVSTPSDEAAKLLDASIRQLVSWIDCAQLGGLRHSIQSMLLADPDFLMGRVLSLGMDALGTGRSIWVDPKFGQELDELESDARKRGNRREQSHARAVRLFANGGMQSACVEWEKILAEHPNDLLALKFAHDAYFFLGDKLGKRDSVGRVIDKWDKGWPCFSYLHGMYAFGLEECGQYKEAEAHARLGLKLQPQDCWSTHAIAHCFEMASDFRQGIQFMESTRQDWAPCYLACHNYWHTALFYIEKGDLESALSIYDEEVDRRCASGAMLDMVDAASLLTRLELEGMKLGRERWEELLRLARSHREDHVLAFNDAHIAMVLGKATDGGLISEEEMAGHSRSMEQFANCGKGDNARLTKDFGLQLSESIKSFDVEKYEDAFDMLFPIRTQIYRIGGSDAQRDVFAQLLIHAGIRSGHGQQRDKALMVIQERNKIKPNSLLAERLMQRHQQQGPACSEIGLKYNNITKAD